MRDPARIERVLDLLRQTWATNPDQRLGQLFANLIGHNRDPFFVADEELEAALEMFAREGWGFLEPMEEGRPAR